MNPQGSSDPSINVFAHFAGSPEVLAPKSVKVRELPHPGEPGLEPPEALVMMDPGELAEIHHLPGGDDEALVFVSYGRKADLTGKRKLIESALAANRKIEVHVFDEPPGRH